MTYYNVQNIIDKNMENTSLYDSIDGNIGDESSSDSIDGDINCIVSDYYIRYKNTLKKLQKLQNIEYTTDKDYVISFLTKSIYAIIIEFIKLCNEFDSVIKKLSKKYDDITIKLQLEPINVIIHTFIEHLEYPNIDRETISFILNISDLYHDIFVLDNVISNTKNMTYPKTMYNDVGIRFKKFGQNIQNIQNIQNTQNTQNTQNIQNINGNPVVAILMNDIECLLYAVYSTNNTIETSLNAYLRKMIIFHRLLLCLHFNIPSNIDNGLIKFATKKMLNDFDRMERNLEQFIEKNRTEKYSYIIDNIIDMIEIIHTTRKM